MESFMESVFNLVVSLASNILGFLGYIFYLFFIVFILSGVIGMFGTFVARSIRDVGK